MDGKPLGDRTEHYWLVQRMARATGHDPAAAMAEGRLDEASWAAMVDRCRGCQATCTCRDWLAEAERTATLGETPREAPMAGCENALTFRAL